MYPYRFRHVLIGIVLVALLWAAGHDSRKAFDDCMRAGRQSEDTCRAYTR